MYQKTYFKFHLKSFERVRVPNYQIDTYISLQLNLQIADLIFIEGFNAKKFFSILTVSLLLINVNCIFKTFPMVYPQ